MSKTLRASLATAALAASTLAATVLAAPSGAETFDFSVSGIRVGQATLEIKQSGDTYSAASRIDTAGLVGLFADFFYDGQASGRFAAGGKLVPQIFTATSKSPRALRHSRIEWKDGTPVKVSVEPPRSSAPDPAQQAGTLDPVSAGVRLLRDTPVGEICDTAIDVFDGSRLSRLKLEPAAEKDGKLVCKGFFSRIEGEAHTLTSRREFPFSLVFARTGGGMATVERIEAPTNFGQAVIARMD